MRTSVLNFITCIIVSERDIHESWNCTKKEVFRWEILNGFNLKKPVYLCLAETGSEDIDILPNGLAFISSVSDRALSPCRGLPASLSTEAIGESCRWESLFSTRVAGSIVTAQTCVSLAGISFYLSKCSSWRRSGDGSSDICILLRWLILFM